MSPSFMSHAVTDINTAINNEPEIDTNTKVDTHLNAGIVIIGAGMAGSRFAIELARARSTLSSVLDSTTHTKTAQNSVPITLISKEPQVGYNRIMLSPVLAGDSAFDDTYLYDQSVYESLGITVLAGVTVTTMDTVQQCIELSNGQMIDYAKAVIATGSTARVIPFPNHTARGVHVFRDVADVTVLTAYAKQGKTGLVIGGGVLGLEAACALANQGANMTVVHVDHYVLNRQLDLPAAQLLQAELSRRHVGLVVSANTEAIVVNDAGEVSGLSLKDGRTLPADFIVMAVGVMPNITLAKDSGIEVNRGIIVDEFMHTSCTNVYAIGECVELAGELFGMVAPVNQQVDTLVSVLKNDTVHDVNADGDIDSEVDGNTECLANEVIQDDKVNQTDTIVSTAASSSRAHWQPFISKPLSLKLKVSGVSAFSAGQIAFDEDEASVIETLVYRQPVLNHYHCLYLKYNKLVGAVLYGDVDDGSFYSQLIMDNTDITGIKETLIFGEAYCDLEILNTSDTPNDLAISDTSNPAITTIIGDGMSGVDDTDSTYNNSADRNSANNHSADNSNVPEPELAEDTL